MLCPGAKSIMGWNWSYHGSKPYFTMELVIPWRQPYHSMEVVILTTKIPTGPVVPQVKTVRPERI